MLAWPAFLLVLGAAPAPDPTPLCQLAMKNRPLEQLQERATCRVKEVRDAPKGSALRRAVVLEVPLDAGIADILLIEVAAGKTSAWQDLGAVGGEREDTAPGSSLVMRETSALERFEVTSTKLGPVIEVASQWARDTSDKGGSWRVERHDLLYCAHLKELVCLNLNDRWTLSAKGDGAADLKPGAWTRAVSLSKAGELVIGAQEGTGELSPFDPGAGTHTFAALADKPFVRRYPTVSLVHPDQADPQDPLGLPELKP